MSAKRLVDRHFDLKGIEQLTSHRTLNLGLLGCDMLRHVVVVSKGVLIHNRTDTIGEKMKKRPIQERLIVEECVKTLPKGGCNV